MLGAGTVINPIIKVVTTVAILAAVYFFIVRPVLDTTDDALDRAGGAVTQANNAFDSAATSAAVSRAQSYASSLQSTWPAAAREVRQCIKRAAGRGTMAAERCASQAQSLVHGAQSDRSFALSYADSLAAQGDSAGAARVEDCVDAAGFEPAKLKRCRDLADRLLFG